MPGGTTIVDPGTAFSIIDAIEPLAAVAGPLGCAEAATSRTARTIIAVGVRAAPVFCQAARSQRANHGPKLTRAAAATARKKPAATMPSL